MFAIELQRRAIKQDKKLKQIRNEKKNMKTINIDSDEKKTIAAIDVRTY